MNLICVSCGNCTYFEVEVEAIKTIESDAEGLIIDDANMDAWNYSDTTLRGNLDDIVSYVLRDPNETVTESGNKYITCAKCGSRNVVVPCVKWNPPLDNISIDDELLENRNEFLNLRKERHRENFMPVLWQS